MIKLVILLFLEVLFFKVGIAQNTWKRSESNSHLEIGDVAISSKNEYFFTLKNNHNVFHSKDSGTTWQEVMENNGKNKFYITRDKSYLKVINNQVYCVSCAGSSKRYLYNGEIFDLLPNYTNTPSENLIINQQGRVFYVDYFYIYNTDSSWNPNFNNFIFNVQNNYSIKSTNFYTDDNNYITTTNFVDSSIIYKVKTDSFHTSSIYSRYKILLGSGKTFVSKAGTIYFMDLKGSTSIFNYVSNVDQKTIINSSLNTIHKVKLVHYYFINSQAEIFLVTDKGVFINNGIDEDQWTRCHLMSDQLPSLPSIYTTLFDAKFYFKDSLNALISYGDNCGQSEYYCFSPKFKKWKTINLNIHIDNLTNVVKNKRNRLFGYRPCENFFGRSYYQSDNNGKDWEPVIIYRDFATSVGINKDGEAIAIENNGIYLHNSSLDTWQNITSPVDPSSSDITLFHIYSAKNELFLSANSNKHASNEKNYLFHSADGGLSWTEIKSFVQSTNYPANDFKIFIDNNGDWIVYEDQGRWTKDEVLVSKDRGKTWNIDSRFKNFYIGFINQLPDKRYIITGTYNNSKRGTFVIDSLGNYIIYSQYYDKNPANIYLDRDTRAFGYTTNSYTDIPFYSNDLGINVVEDESGLKPTDKETRLIRSAIYEAGDKITLNLAYDGIYTTAQDIFSNVTDANNHIEKYAVFQNNEWIRIEKKDQSAWNNSEKLQVFNLLGQSVLSNNLQSSNGLISTRLFTSGIYLLQVKNGNTSTQVVKFLVK